MKSTFWKMRNPKWTMAALCLALGIYLEAKGLPGWGLALFVSIVIAVSD